MLKKKVKDGAAGARHQYGRTDLTALRKFEEEQKKGREGQFPFWKVEVGKNKIRILPPWNVNAKFWFKQAFEHFIAGNRVSEIVGDSGYEGPLSVSCALRMGVGEKCPVCERQRDLRATRSRQDRELARAIWPSKRYYVNMVDLGDPEEGVRVWAFGPVIFEDLYTSDKLDEDEGGYAGKLTDPREGRNILLIRKGTTVKTTRYTVKFGSAPVPLQDSAWLDQMHDLDVVTRPPSYEEAQELLLASPAGIGGGGEDGEQFAEEEEEEKPVRRGGADDDDDDDTTF